MKGLPDVDHQSLGWGKQGRHLEKMSERSVI